MKKNIKKVEPIAIIGASCRFPGGAVTLEKYWQMLLEGKDTITEIPESRWEIKSFYSKNKANSNKSNSKWGGFLENCDHFDASFFGISPREANIMDPQQRILLELCYEAMENGGILPGNLRGTNAGVYIGAFTLDYKLLQFTEKNRHMIDAHTATGTMMNMISNRISYIYDFQGPSLSIDTACSSSMVAIHLACQALEQKDCSLAIAGGVNIIIKPEYFIAESNAGMLSPTGRSKTFDKNADGYVRGEGAGILILKSLKNALKDNDCIYAIIKSTAVNQDGKTPGITVPGIDAQKVLIETALKKADLSANDIQYIEAHGTGTAVGDKIEANAIGSFFSALKDNNEKTLIGSVKTNIGHTEAASGVASVIKTMMAIKNRKIPPHLHVQTVNPAIDLDNLKLRIPKHITNWPSNEKLLTAGINSFGFGGTNAHMILQEHPVNNKQLEINENDKKIHNLLISAKNRNSLYNLAKKYLNFCREIVNQKKQITLCDLAYSAALHREHYNYRLAITVKDYNDLIQKLEAFISENDIQGVSSNILFLTSEELKKEKLVFVCSGMGPQWWAMGHELYKSEPVFKMIMDKCDTYFKEISKWSILEEMLKQEDESKMEETIIAQPANFLIQVSLAGLLKSWGVKPGAIIGHSAGETAAAYIAGIYSLEDAIKITYYRSLYQQKISGQGKMASIGISCKDFQPLLKKYGDEISIAAINSPNSITITGEEPALKNIVDEMQNTGNFAVILNVKVPYHSRYIDPYYEEFCNNLKNIKGKKNNIPIFSTVTGKSINGGRMDNEYWWKNMRQPVLFEKAIKAMGKKGYNNYLEISPHPVLINYIEENLENEVIDLRLLSSLRRKTGENIQVYDILSNLHTKGLFDKWSTIYQNNGKFCQLPNYAWDHEIYWHESKNAQIDRVGYKRHPLLGKRADSPLPCWEQDINLTNNEYLIDHKIQGAIVFPAAGYIEIVNAGILELYGKDTSFCLENVEFRKAYFIKEEIISKQTLLIDQENSTFKLYNSTQTSNDAWELNSCGMINTQMYENTLKKNLDTLKQRCTKEVSVHDCYKYFKNFGLEYGKRFQGFEKIWQGKNEALAKISLHNDIKENIEQYSIHPVILDLCFQTLAAALPFDNTDSFVYMPIGVKKGVKYTDITDDMYTHAVIKNLTLKELCGDIQLFDKNGEIILEIKDCKALSLNNNAQNERIRPQNLYTQGWIENENPITFSSEQINSIIPGFWFIFNDNKGVGQYIEKKLIEKGDEVIYIDQEIEQEIADSEYLQNKLQKIIKSMNTKCKGIIHLCSLNSPKMQFVTNDDLGKAEKLGSISILNIIKALSNIDKEQIIKLWVVTQNAQFVTEEQKDLNCIQTPIWGITKVIGHQEHYKQYGALIDIDNDERSLESLTGIILIQNREDLLAIRNGKQYVQRVFKKNRTAVPLIPVFKTDGAYVITGGLGGIGIEVANWMIKQGAKHLILAGRTKLPDRGTWQNQKHSKDVEFKINAILELEKRGASIYPVTADISDKAQLKHALDEFKNNSCLPIKGVMHAAGVAHPRVLTEISSEEFSRIMKPKVQGSWNLHNYFLNDTLDFFVMFSSIASVIVLAGQGNYSAANSFMDSLAYYRRMNGLPGLSINWGPWSDAGMATKLDLVDYFERRGFFSMTKNQGIEILAGLMGQKEPQVLVINVNWKTFVSLNYPLGKNPPLIDIVVKENEANDYLQMEDESGNSILDELLAINTPEEQKEKIIDLLIDIVASIIRVEKAKLDKNASLANWGIDSMIAMEIKGSISSHTGSNINIMEIISGLSICELADIVQKDLATN